MDSGAEFANVIIKSGADLTKELSAMLKALLIFSIEAEKEEKKNFLVRGL